MATPNDNTEIIRMFREFKDVMLKSVTPVPDRNFKDYVSNFSSSKAGPSNVYMPKIAKKLNYTSMDDSVSTHVSTSDLLSDSTFMKSFQTPDSLKRKLAITESELQTSKAKLFQQESFISVMEPSNKKLCSNLELKLDSMRRQKEMDNIKIEELNGKWKCSVNEATYLKSQVHDLERQRKIDSDKMDLKLLSLQQECSNLKIDASELKTQKAEIVRKLNNEIGRLELQLTMLTQDNERSEDYIETLKRQNHDLAEKAAECNTLQKELQEAQMKIKTLENKIEVEKDSALIVHSLKSELQMLPELQKENRELKKELNDFKEHNMALYQEKMWAFQEKLMQAEKKNIALTKLQVENEQLKENISQWESLFDDDSAIKRSPNAFSRKLSEYQKNEVALTNKLSQSIARCETLEKEKQALDETIKSLNQRLQKFQMSSPVQENLLKRLQRKIIFLTRERDSCRKLLESYQSETTMTGGQLNNEYVMQLESINVEYKNALEKLENEIEELKRKIKRLQESNNNELLLSEMNTLREENSLFKARIEKLEEEKDNLNAKLSDPKLSNPAGPWSGKIVHLRHNPLESAIKDRLAEFQKLREENDYLKKRVAVLEEEGSTADDVTGKVAIKMETEGAASTVQALKEQLASAERQQKFILENARIKSTEFREAVYRLTGYRFDVPTAENFKLSHMYAESKNDFMLFQVDSQSIQVVETPYSKQLSERMALYLHQHDSFPAFLASLTLDLFSQQTCIMSS